MKKYIKKGFIAIEAVIIAAICIMGGMAGTSAFLKNGQGAQAKSASAINNTIDMIEEEFDFSTNTGETPEINVPGGETALPDGMNEYGFYFNKRYSVKVEEDTRYLSTDGYIINEDGSISRSETLDYFANFLSYEKNKIITNQDNDIWFEVQGNGETISLTHETTGVTLTDYFTLLNEPTTLKNQYGFYFEEKYSGISSEDVGQEFTYIFHSDGSVSIIEISPAITGATFVQENVYLGDYPIGSFSENGTKLTLYTGEVFELEQ